MPSTSNADPRPVVAITMGDPAGIGPEIITRALADAGVAAAARCQVLGDARVLERAAALSGAALNLRVIRSPGAGDWGAGEIQVVDLANADPAASEAGSVSALYGRAS